MACIVSRESRSRRADSTPPRDHAESGIFPSDGRLGLQRQAAKKFRDDLESELAGIPPRCFQDDARTAQTSVCRPSSVYEVVKPAGFTAKVT